MKLHIKSLIPFKNWEQVVQVAPRDCHAALELVRVAAINFEVCNITLLLDDGTVVARSRWRAKSQAPDIETLMTLEAIARHIG